MSLNIHRNCKECQNWKTHLLAAPTIHGGLTWGTKIVGTLVTELVWNFIGRYVDRAIFFI